MCSDNRRYQQSDMQRIYVAKVQLTFGWSETTASILAYNNVENREHKAGCGIEGVI